MSTTTIRIQATETQLQQFERQCELNELLLAQSLRRRFQIPATQENLDLCCLIEESGASPELTNISVRAAMLHRAINALMP